VLLSPAIALVPAILVAGLAHGALRARWLPAHILAPEAQ
jgi:hypothetical protein